MGQVRAAAPEAHTREKEGAAGKRKKTFKTARREADSSSRLGHPRGRSTTRRCTIHRHEGNVAAWSSPGDRLQGLGARGRRSPRPGGSTRAMRPRASQSILDVRVKDPDPPRVGHPALRDGGLEVKSIRDVTPIPQRVPVRRSGGECKWHGNIGPVCRLGRREGMKLFLRGSGAIRRSARSRSAISRRVQHGKTRKAQLAGLTACSCAKSRR